MALAWQIAALMRHPPKKRLPPLKSLQARTRHRPRAPQTPEHMMMIAKMWTALHGGTIVDKSKAH